MEYELTDVAGVVLSAALSSSDMALNGNMLREQVWGL